MNKFGFKTIFGSNTLFMDLKLYIIYIIVAYYILPNFQRLGGGLTGSQFLEGVTGKEEVAFRGEGRLQFSPKKN